MKRRMVLLLCVILSVQMIMAVNWFRNVSVRDGLLDNHICDIEYDSRGILYIATKLGIDRFDGNRIKPLRVDYPAMCHPERIVFDPAGALWAVWKDSLMVYDGKGFTADRKITAEKAKAGGFRLPGVMVSDMVFQGRRLSYMTPDGSLYHAEDCGAVPTKYPSACGKYRKISQGRDGRIWLYDGYSEGLAYMDCHASRPELTEVTAFRGMLVSDVVCTPGGRIIVATNSNGIYVLDHGGKMQEHITHTAGTRVSLMSDHVSSLLVNNGFLFAGTTKKGMQIARIHPLDARVVQLDTDGDISFFNTTPGGKLVIGFDGDGIGVYDSIGAAVASRRFTTANSALPSDLVLSVLQGADNTVYSSYGGGVFRFDGNAFSIIDNSDSLRFCRHLLQAGDGSIVAGTFDKGLVHKGSGTYNFTNSPLRTNSITCLRPLRERVLVGTANGLYLYDHKDRKITSVPGEELEELLVLDLLVDSHGYVWIGTVNGVLVLDHRLRVVRRVTHKDHLSSDYVRALASDGNGDVWVTTVNGINHIKIKSAGNESIDLVCTPYYIRNEVGDIDFDRHSIACMPDGRILAGGSGVYVVIDPSSAIPRATNRKVYLTGIKVDGEEAGPGLPLKGGRVPYYGSVLECGKVDLSPFHSMVLEFSTLSPEGDGNTLMEYRFEDDEDWAEMEGNSLTLINLPSGSHRLVVREVGSGVETGLEINVIPPLWRSPAAIVFYILVALAGLVLLVRWWREKIRREEYRKRMENVFVSTEAVPASADEAFLTKAKNLVEQHMSEDGFSVEGLADLMAMSRSNLYKKMTKASGQTPVEFIRLIRLRKAKQMLDDGETSVSQVAYAIGMSPKFLSKSFKEEYGVPPARYIAELSAGTDRLPE